MKTHIQLPQEKLSEPQMDQLNAQILACRAQVSQDWPEMTKYLEEFALVEIVADGSTVQAHNLSAYLTQMNSMIEGYTSSIPSMVNA